MRKLSDRKNGMRVGVIGTGHVGLPLMVDGRNVFSPHEMGALGFTYYPTGRRPIT